MTTPTNVQVRLQLRADTAANWTSVNPTLLSGELGLETNTNKIKIGDGTTAWSSLGYFPFVVSGGTVLGNLEIGTTGTLTFEGSTADGFETTLAVTNPTADRTITLPNQSGNVIVSGNASIVNADISASAAIAHSKLANITAGSVLLGNASNVPTATALSGDVTVNSSGVTAIGSGVIVNADINASAAIDKSKISGTAITAADTGTVTSTMIADGTIVDGDINASAAITDTKLATISTTGKVNNSATTATSSNTASAIVARDSSGNFSAGTITANLSGNASTVTTNANLTGDVTSVGNATSIAAGVIVDGDISATAEIAVSKLADGAARQVLQTDSAGTGVEWTDSLDLPGTLDVTQAATFDSSVTIAGDLTVNGTTTNINTQNLVVEDKNVILGDVATPSDTTADGGGITLKGTTDKMINWVDSTDSWTSSEHIDLASGKVFKINGTEVLSGTALGSNVLITSTNITDGTIVDGDISATAEIAVSKLADGAARQLLQTDAAGTGVEWTNNVDIPGTLDVTSTATFDGVIGASAGAAATPSITFTGDLNTGIYSPGADQVAISTGGTGRVFIGSVGRVGVGTTADRVTVGITPVFQIEGLDGGTSSTSFTRNSNDANPPVLFFNKTRATVVGGNTSVNSGDIFGAIYFSGSDGTDLIRGAQITSLVDGTPGTGSVPGRLIFSTTPSSSTTPVERMRISQVGITTLTSAASTAPFIAKIDTTEVVRIDSSGRLLVGTSSSLVGGYSLQVAGTSGGIFEGFRFSDNNAAGVFRLYKSRGTTVGTNTALVADDPIGTFQFLGADGSSYIQAASIFAAVDATPGTNSMPGRIVFSTTPSGSATPTERMRITSDGSVGIGVTPASSRLHVRGSDTGTDVSVLRLQTPGLSNLYFRYKDGTNDNSAWELFTGAGEDLLFSPGASERARIDSSGRLLVGISSSITTVDHVANSGAPMVQVGGTSVLLSSILLNNWGTAAASAGNLQFAKSKSGTVGTRGVVASGDNLGALLFEGDDGTNFIRAALIRADVDGTPGTNDMPGRLVFSTTASGAAIPTERMRINNVGTIFFGNGETAASPTATTVSATGGSGTNIAGANLTIQGGRGTGTGVGGNIVITTAPAGTSGSTLNSAVERMSVLNTGTIIFGNGATASSPTATTVSSTGGSGTDIAGANLTIQGGAGTGSGKGGDIIINTAAASTTGSTANTQAERFRITSDGIRAYNQPAPAAVNATATLTIANLKAGIITSTSAAATDMTLPTGTNTEGGFSGVYTNMTFEWSVINTGPNLVRVLANTDHTIVGSGSVATGTSGRFASRRTASNTFVTYRLA